MFCPPAASAHSLPPPPTHKPRPHNLLFFDHKAENNLVPVSISSPVPPQATKENHFHFFYSILHFHLSIHAKLSQGLLFMWLYRSWCHLNHFLAVSLTLLSFTAKAWKYFCTSSIPSHSLFYSPPFLPAPEKTMLIVMMFCPPSASVHSLPPPPTHQPLASISCFSEHHPKATTEDRFHNLYSTPVTWITR